MQEEMTVDLREYLQVLGKWKWLIAGVTALAVVTSGILSWFVLPPVYQAGTVLLATQNSTQVGARPSSDLQEVVNSVSRLPEMTINTYITQVKSQEVLRRVIERLQLDPALYSPGTLAGMITVQAAKDTNMINLQVQGGDPRLAAGIGNTLAEEFVRFMGENNQQQLAKSLDLIQQQGASSERELLAAVEALRRFDAQSRGLDYLGKEMQGKLDDLSRSRSRISQVQVEIAQLMAGRQYLAQRLQEAAQPAGVDQASVTAVPDTLSSGIEAQLSNREVALAEKQAELLGLRANVQELEKAAAVLQEELSARRTERERLQRATDRLKNAYDILAQKITEMRIARSMNVGEISLQVIARALVPASPVRPNRRLNLAVALVLGLMVSLMLAFLLEYLDNTVHDAPSVQKHLGLPVLGSIHLAPVKSSLPGHEGKRSAVFPLRAEIIPRVQPESAAATAEPWVGERGEEV